MSPRIAAFIIPRAPALLSVGGQLHLPPVIGSGALDILIQSQVTMHEAEGIIPV